MSNINIDNKLISLYMANRDVKGNIDSQTNSGYDIGTLHFTLIPGCPVNYMFPESHKYFSPYYGKWDHDWSWLMCVVEKIEREYPNYDFVIDGCSAYIKNNNNTIATGSKIIISNTEKTKIQSVYKCVVEFLKLHNNNL